MIREQGWVIEKFSYVYIGNSFVLSLYENVRKRRQGEMQRRYGKGLVGTRHAVMTLERATLSKLKCFFWFVLLIILGILTLIFFIIHKMSFKLSYLLYILKYVYLLHSVHLNNFYIFQDVFIIYFYVYDYLFQ